MRRRLIVWIGLSLYLLTGSVWGESTADIEADFEAENYRLRVQWVDQFRVYLETSRYAQFRVASGIRLLRGDDPIDKKRGARLVAEVLGVPAPDVASLWQVALDCTWKESEGWCEPAGVYEMLMRADPGNAATPLLRIDRLRQIDDLEMLDTEANRQLLLRAAAADRYDTYWGRGADKLYAEALNFTENRAAPTIPDFEPSESLYELPKHVYAFDLTMSITITNPLPSYSSIIDLCRMQVRQQRVDTIKACKKLAGLLRNRSDSALARYVGYGLEKAMLDAIDPDDPDILKWQNRQQVFTISQRCFSQGWLHSGRWPEADQATMMAYAKNLSDLGELQATELSIKQEYETSPENFTVNPAECDKLQDLDDEAIANLLKGQSASDVWLTMQTEAGNSRK